MANLFPPSFYDAIIKVESGGDPNAVSKKGALGRMQVMPATARNPGYGVKPAKNSSSGELERVGKDYYDAMYKKFGDHRLALAAYNAGPTAVERADRNISKLPEETRKYVPKVLSLISPANASPIKEASYSPTDKGVSMAREPRVAKIKDAGDFDKALEEANIRSDTPEAKQAQEIMSYLIPTGLIFGTAAKLAIKAVTGTPAAMAAARATIQKTLGRTTRTDSGAEVARYAAPAGGRSAKFISRAEREAASKARRNIGIGAAGLAAAGAGSALRNKDLPPLDEERDVETRPEPKMLEDRDEVNTTSQQGDKVDLTNVPPKVSEAAKKMGIFERLFPNATVEYKYPSGEDRGERDQSSPMRKGGMVYRAKGGKVGKATKRGVGKAMGGAYINYGKPVVKEKSFASAKPLKAGGRVGPRGCGTATRGYGKAMKGK
jgi:hypothetical protein